MAKYYFADKAEQCEDLFDYGKCHLGEDRWLTHLFMIGAKKRYQIQMCTSAFCKTEAVQTYRSLIKQRRRWFLGFITNEVCMLTDMRIWKRYPILAVVRFMQNTIRTTALLFFIMLVSIVSTSKKVQDLPVGFIGISLGLNWLMMIYFGAKLKRYKIWAYPLMFVVNPFFNWFYVSSSPMSIFPPNILTETDGLRNLHSRSTDLGWTSSRRRYSRFSYNTSASY
jgi:chitin synthase